MSFVAALLAGGVAGLASAPHCAAMCGPVAAFACRGEQRSAPLRYQLGRMVGYSALGATAGGLGVVVASFLSSPVAGAMLSFSIAVGLAVTAYRLWRAGESRPAPLVRLGRAQRGPGWLRRLPNDPGALGVLTALLPCGALVAATLLAAGSGSVVLGAVTLIAFSVTTSFGLLGAALLAQYLRRRPAAAKGLALLLALGAVVMIVRPLRAIQHGAPVCEAPSTPVAAP